MESTTPTSVTRPTRPPILLRSSLDMVDTRFAPSGVKRMCAHMARGYDTTSADSTIDSLRFDSIGGSMPSTLLHYHHEGSLIYMPSKVPRYHIAIHQSHGCGVTHCIVCAIVSGSRLRKQGDWQHQVDIASVDTIEHLASTQAISTYICYFCSSYTPDI